MAFILASHSLMRAILSLGARMQLTSVLVFCSSMAERSPQEMPGDRGLMAWLPPKMRLFPKKSLLWG